MALQVCQITPVSQAHGSNPETPRRIRATPPPEGNLLRFCRGLSSPPVEEYPIGGGGLLLERMHP